MAEIWQVVTAVMVMICAVGIVAIYLWLRAHTPRRGSMPPPRMKAQIRLTPEPASSRPRAGE